MSFNEERREFPRVPVATRVRYKKNDKEEILMTRDISEGGLFLNAKEPPFVGEMVDLEISLPSSEALIKLKGEVVWRAQGDGCGIRFVRTTAAIREAITQFLKSNAG